MNFDYLIQLSLPEEAPEHDNSTSPKDDEKLYIKINAPVSRMTLEEVGTFLDEVGEIARQEGILSLKHFPEKTDDPILDQCLRWLVAGIEPDDIQERMQVLQEIVLEEQEAKYDMIKIYLALLQHDINIHKLRACLNAFGLTPFKQVDQLRFSDQCTIGQIAILMKRLAELIQNQGYLILGRVAMQFNDRLLQAGLGLVSNNTDPTIIRGQLKPSASKLMEEQDQRQQLIGNMTRLMISDLNERAMLAEMAPQLKSEISRRLTMAPLDQLREFLNTKRKSYSSLDQHEIAGLVASLGLNFRRQNMETTDLDVAYEIDEPLLRWGVIMWRAPLETFDLVLPYAIKTVLRQYRRRYGMIQDGVVALQQNLSPQSVSEKMSIWNRVQTPLPDIFLEVDHIEDENTVVFDLSTQK